MGFEPTTLGITIRVLRTCEPATKRLRLILDRRCPACVLLGRNMATIRKRGDSWQSRIQIKGVAEVAKTFSNRQDAEAWAKVTEAEIIRGVFIKRSDAERTTLGEALDKYAKEVTPNKRGAYQELHRINAWNRDKLAKKSLASLRGVDFATWRDNRLKVVSTATVRLELAVISNLFNVARKEWGMDGLNNPIEGIRLPSVSNARSRVFYDGEEVLLLAALDASDRDSQGRFGKSCRNGYLKPMVLLALETAMRRGELLGMRWEDVRLKDRVVFLPTTKNGQSRSVPLSTKAVEVLNGLPRKLYGAVFDGVTDNAVKLAYIRAVKRARGAYIEAGGDDPRMLVDLHFHDLRHIAVTRLAERLPNIVELAAVSGHTDVRMLKRYYHPKAEELALKIG